MKNSELKKLISQYKELKEKMKKKYANSFKISENLKIIEQRYFHETGRKLKSDMKELM